MIYNENELLIEVEKLVKEGNDKQAYQLIEDNQDVINKKYYEFTRYRIDIMYRLQRYMGAYTIVENELSVPYIPADFENYLNEMKKELINIINNPQAREITFEDLEKNITKLDDRTLRPVLEKLKNFNLTTLLDKFQVLFDKDDISYISKTLLIAALSDCKVDYTYHIKKADMEMDFNPSTIYDIRSSKAVAFMANKFKEFSNVQINALELANRVYINYVLYYYPFEINQDDFEYLLEACIRIVNDMNNSDLPVNKNLDKKKVKEFIKKINFILRGK